MAKGTKKRSKTAPTKDVGKKKSTKGQAAKPSRKEKRIELKKELGSRKPLPGSFTLVYASVLNIRRFWRPLFGVFAVYVVLNIIFASGLISNLRESVGSIKDSSGNPSKSELSRAVEGFATLLSDNSSSNDSTGPQSILFILGSLVFIWTLRQLFAGEKMKVKDAYYNSMAPLIPFLLVLLIIIIQALPLIIGTLALSLVLSGVTAGNILVGTGFVLLFVAFTTWSLYMLSRSIFALYIVTLPNMYPLVALRSAKKLVVFRRWQIMRKILFLPFFTLLVMAILVIPLLMFASFIVAPVFFLLSLFAVLYAHVYLYTLYKEMLL